MRVRRVRWAISLRMGNGFGFVGFGFNRAAANVAGASSSSSSSSISLCVPAQLTEEVYTALAEADCIPRRWHPEGREGLSIQACKALPLPKPLLLTASGP